jgi:hypothetical protein
MEILDNVFANGQFEDWTINKVTVKDVAVTDYDNKGKVGKRLAITFKGVDVNATVTYYIGPFDAEDYNRQDKGNWTAASNYENATVAIQQFVKVLNPAFFEKWAKGEIKLEGDWTAVSTALVDVLNQPNKEVFIKIVKDGWMPKFVSGVTDEGKLQAKTTIIGETLAKVNWTAAELKSKTKVAGAATGQANISDII